MNKIIIFLKQFINFSKMTKNHVILRRLIFELFLEFWRMSRKGILFISSWILFLFFSFLVFDLFLLFAQEGFFFLDVMKTKIREIIIGSYLCIFTSFFYLLIKEYLIFFKNVIFEQISILRHFLHFMYFHQMDLSKKGTGWVLPFEIFKRRRTKGVRKLNEEINPLNDLFFLSFIRDLMG